MFPFRKFKILYGTWLLLLGAFIFSLVDQEWYTTFMASFTFIITIVPFLFQKKYKIYIPPLLLSLIAVFAYATVFLGEVGGYYERFWWWDSMLHLGSAFAFCLLGFVVLLIYFGKEENKIQPWVISIFAFCFASTIGVLWEIFEFFMDQTFGLNMQRSGLMDTMSDLIINSIGAGIASIVGFLYLKGKKVRLFYDLIEEGYIENKKFKD